MNYQDAKSEQLRGLGALWKTLIDRNMKKKDLIRMSKISAASVAKLGRDENVTTQVLLKICEALDCDLSDVVELVREDKSDESNDAIIK